jgi:hypothetical protein
VSLNSAQEELDRAATKAKRLETQRLRDEFAMAALTGLAGAVARDLIGGPKAALTDVAMLAFAIADQMVKIREC